MLLLFYRFLRGAVRVAVSSGFTESFINDCNEQGIIIWDICHSTDEITFCIYEKQLSRLAEISEKAGMDLRIISKTGLPYIIKKDKNRVVLLAGTLCALVFVGLMNTRIWAVQVSGNQTLFDGEILSVMEELGVTVGARKSSIDVKEIQKNFLEIMKSKVLWVSVNIEGMCAEIEIREIVEFKNGSVGIPCNYVADFSGEIKTYQVYSGTPVVGKGSYVRTGDLLISSVIEYYCGGLNFVEADGVIVAKREKTVEASVDSSREKLSYSETKKGYGISLFNVEIPISDLWYKKSFNEKSRNAVHLEINGRRLPFAVLEYDYCNSFPEKNSAPDADYALELYLSELIVQTRASNVLSVKTTERPATGVYYFSGEISCLDFLGKKVPLEIINTE